MINIFESPSLILNNISNINNNIIHLDPINASIMRNFTKNIDEGFFTMYRSYRNNIDYYSDNYNSKKRNEIRKLKFRIIKLVKLVNDIDHMISQITLNNNTHILGIKSIKKKYDEVNSIIS